MRAQLFNRAFIKTAQKVFVPEFSQNNTYHIMSYYDHYVMMYSHKWK